MMRLKRSFAAEIQRDVWNGWLGRVLVYKIQVVYLPLLLPINIFPYGSTKEKRL